MFCECLYSANQTALVKIIHNTVEILGKQQVPQMIIVDKNINQIINLQNLTNVNNIGMIELKKMLLPTMNIKGKNRIFKVSFMVEYQHPLENMFT